MKRYILLFLLAGQILYAQDLKDTELRTEIKEVTVFLQGAQLTREGSISLNKGKTLLKIKGLSPYLDEKSMEIKGDGDFTILSVNHSLNYLNEQKRDEKTELIREKADSLELEISYKKAELGVLSEKSKLLDVNKKLGVGEAGSDLSQLKETVAYYEQEIGLIKKREIQINHEIRKINKKQLQLEKELRVMNEEPDLPTSEIEITVAAERRVEAKLFAKYLVSNAGWFPKFDVRVENVQSPVLLTYKAEVFQQCGEDWDQVKLKFSNVNPRKSGMAPSLKPWRLTYARFTRTRDLAVWRNEDGTVSGMIRDEYGEPLVGASILVKGSTTGSFTNANGEFNLTVPEGRTSFVVTSMGYKKQEIPISDDFLDIKMQNANMALDEVVVRGYGTKKKRALTGAVSSISGAELSGELDRNYYEAGGISRRDQKDKSKPLETAVIETQTSVEFEVKVPYTLRSDGEKRMIDLQTLPIESMYEYKAVPKIDTDAFLVARLVNWDQKQLLEGEANLYMEGTFVGRTILNANVLSDTLDLSLGRDKGIVIAREEIEEFKQSKAIGSHQVDIRAYKITIKNKRAENINIKIYDQIPVAIINQIDVKVKEMTAAALNEEKGELIWDLVLKPLEQKELKLVYEVKYPKKEQIYLE